ncbi:MAG: 3-oxoacyl-ACP synthase III [Desulfobacterales bacterium]|nr:MAG: 3-oxoacyl-ACP synthase III [Desulfobacterales bacterium]
MLSGNVAIEAVAYVLAPHRITSKSIEAQIEKTMNRLNLKPGMLEGLTGIRERRFWDPGVMPSEVATLAARKVIARAGIDQDKIDCLINTSVCKDYIEPSVASLVHGNLNLSPNCMNYDIGNACLGFMDAMVTMILMIEAGMIRYGLIVDGEGSREAVEATIKRLQTDDVAEQVFRENFATLTLGSGAVAMILCHKDRSTSGHIINGSVTRAATQHNRLCLGQKDHMIADAHRVLVHGVELAHTTWKLACQTLDNWRDETIDLYIPHQVSARNMDALNRTLGLTPEKAHLNFYTLCNIGPAALPITLAMAEEEGRTLPDSHVALMGIGSGLNCTMMSVTW